MIRILVSDNMSDVGLERIREAEGVELDYQPGLDEAALAEAIKGAQGLLIRSGSRVTAKVIEEADELKVVGRAGIGVDNIDVAAASRRGILVMNTPTGNAITTAEHSISLMMSLARWIPRGTATLKDGQWAKKKLKGRELRGKTLGVIGLGGIGRIVADLAQGLKMRVIGFDPVMTAAGAAALGIELVSLEELWPQADVITMHTPLTDSTRGLIDDEVLGKLKDGVLLVNCARGGVYDEEAVLRGLESGKIGGAAFDVFVQEPPPADHPLLAHERFICTPHLGASTVEAQERVAEQIADQAIAYLKTGAITNGLNAPSLDASTRRTHSRRGRTSGTRSDASSCSSIASSRSASSWSAAAPIGGDAQLRTIAAATLGGYLEPLLGMPVNTVSARPLAEDRGIEVEEERTPRRPGWASSFVWRGQRARPAWPQGRSAQTARPTWCASETSKSKRRSAD